MSLKINVSILDVGWVVQSLEYDHTASIEASDFV